ncbi:hypothetical protein FQN54_002898 [Arachnomyces sp. PD_36]|nr:hypothetical protein FQN54_002898 [Arachnomyces sp. PD_36]
MEDQDHQDEATASETPVVNNESISTRNNNEVPSGDTAEKTETAIDESSRLRELQADIRDQDDLERDIGRQADRLLAEQADERDQKRLERTRAEKEKLAAQILKLHQRLSQPIGTAARVRVQGEIDNAESRQAALDVDLEQIQQRIDERHQDGEDDTQGSSTGRLPNESRRDYLIRTGKITPFSRVGAGRTTEGSLETLKDALIDAEDERDEEVAVKAAEAEPVSHRHLMLPGFNFDETSEASSTDASISKHRQKRRRLQRGTIDKAPEDDEDEAPRKTRVSSDIEGGDSDEFVDRDEVDSAEDDEFMPDTIPEKQPLKRSRKATTQSNEDVEDLRGLDDGNEQLYQSRLQRWVSRRSEARKRARRRQAEAEDEDEGGPDGVDSGDIASVNVEDEWFLPHPQVPDTEISDGYRVPGDIYPFLFDYQKTGVQWLWELYLQQVGGIIGDEMGLGKTIQVISFLAGLHYSKRLTKPIIVVCPATVMKQWVNEFHRWWPPFRVSILHTSGSGMINVKNESSREDALASEMWDPRQPRGLTNGQKSAKRIVKRVLEEGHVLVTTYSGLQTYASLLIPVDWECAVLDEGHKIRNPNTAITIYCKELRTPSRVILSGTPMQNNLSELWSLFDFVFPMRLGTLVNFRNQFEFPIRQGGYANASNLQVQTASKCAETLKDAISPYLLQRFKVDVAADLPKKSEHVLFCKLTKIQRKAYEAFLGSDDMTSIMNGKRQVLYGVDILRKICNHPDLQDHKLLSVKPGYNYGSGVKSGKMQIVKSLLELWRETGHKTLLFAQHRIMLDILERFVKTLEGFKYYRMDGTTPIHARQDLVDEFNKAPNVHVFLLTTKVGGIGVNLTGADRVIIYDPDWNPSTDVQARERAWRLGQKREVKIYRLMTAGTIEEKIYHRQIFKQFLTNKILRDPKQRQTFQMKDLHDLFSLGDDGQTETSTLFKDAEVTYENQGNTEPGSNANPTPTTNESTTTKKDEGEDIRNVAGVASLERFQGEEDSTAENPTPDEGGSSNSEARLMEGIFARSGVQSALEHDQIVSGKRKVKADPRIIEAEAKKVAAEAAAELKRAGEVARSVPIGTPTWTGQFGVAGRPGEGMRPAGTASAFGAGGSSSASRRSGAGPSSASLLANLSNRSTASSGRSSSNTPRSNTPTRSSSSSTQPRGKDFMVMIRDYLVTHGGQVHTQMLIDHFNRFCTTPQATAEFKEMLKTIAVLEKGGGGNGGRGRWVLKPEYARRR